MTGVSECVILASEVMEINWLGHSCFRIRGSRSTIVTDPYSPEWRTLPAKLSANIVTVSHRHPGHSYTGGISGESRLISGPGEYEINDILVVGLATFHDAVRGEERGRNTVYLLEVDEIAICHLGDLGHKFSGAQLEELGSVDILLTPVGGISTIGASLAAEVVRQIGPRVVIPMHYKVDALDTELEPAARFLNEVGVKEVSSQPKLSITRARLPSDPQIVLLDC